MEKWETCEIHYVCIKSGGFFSGIPTCRWEARRITTSGVEVIHKSPDFSARFAGIEFRDQRYPQGGIAAAKGLPDNEQCDTEYEKMIAKLGLENWQPIKFNANGWIKLMSRPVIDANTKPKERPESHIAESPINLLEQLAKLRDAGILTEQEFQAKKVEILKRL